MSREDEVFALWAERVRAAQPEAPPTPEPGPAPAALTRDALRNRRKREVRAHTVNVGRLSPLGIEEGRQVYPERPGIDYRRPSTRGECEGGERPCPYVSCGHHLFLDVSPRNGSIKLNFPDLEVWELPESCVLDVADRDGATLEEVSALFNVTRARIGQIEERARRTLKRRHGIVLGEFVPEGRARLRVVQADEALDDEDEDAIAEVVEGEALGASEEEPADAAE